MSKYVKTLVLAVIAVGSGLAFAGMASAQTESASSSSASAPRGPGGPGGQGGGGGRMFDEMDANKDGAIEKIEAKGRLADNFDAIDADKDGKITREEIRAYREKMAPMGGQRGQGQGGGQPPAQPTGQ